MRTTAILGGAGGIGRTIAAILLEAGERVFLLDTGEAKGQAASLLKDWPEQCAFVACNLADASSIASAFDHIAAEARSLDAFINAAGIIRRGRFLEVSASELDEMLQVNVSGVYLALQAATQLLQVQGSGRIVNIASAHGLRTTAERSTYAMCKGAILALTRALAVELGTQGVLVNAIAPGPVSTGMQDAAQESRQRWQAATPLGRVASADEVARTAVFLASRDNTFINGETIIIDGGAHVAM